ncbi:MAG: hypothetical protein EOO61_04870 [Hymenobacter sp.]|nr:MAG: hypothetical protein EOO61_04870 [Hymenobacter sp.]
MAWNDETKAQAVQMYLDAEPTPTNSMEIVKQISDDIGESPNRVRMYLSQAKRDDGSSVYIKKDGTAAKPAAGGKTAASGDKAPRVSKEGAQQALTAAIEEAGAEVDAEIISKLTGKAAQYFTGVLKAAAGGDQED